MLRQPNQGLKIETLLRCRGRDVPNGSLLFTTHWLRSTLQCSEDELELVALPAGRYLAYNALAYGRGLPVNVQASRALRGRHNGPLQIYGDAVLLREAC